MEIEARCYFLFLLFDLLVIYLRNRKIFFSIKCWSVSALWYLVYGALALLGGCGSGSRVSWPGQVPTVLSAVSTCSVVAETTPPYINPSHQHFSWGWQVPQLVPSLCPYVWSALHTAMNRKVAGSSQIAGHLFCSVHWPSGPEGTHIISEGAISAAKSLVRTHIWLTIRESTLKRTCGNGMSA